MPFFQELKPKKYATAPTPLSPQTAGNLFACSHFLRITMQFFGNDAR